MTDKLTLQALQSFLWEAADILRGAMEYFIYRLPSGFLLRRGAALAEGGGGGGVLPAMGT